MEVDSGADSVSSTPQATHLKLGGAEDKSIIRLMCSFGGKILPRPHDNQLRYVGGDTRIVAIHRNTTYSTLVSKLSKFLNNSDDFTVKYQLPNEDLDALITVTADEDVENMMEEFERLTSQPNSNSNSNSSNNSRVPRLRLFLFPNNVSGIEGSDTPRSRTSSIASLLDGSKKRESWFLDALNGGAALERRRSEASSIVSEVPDYLFGLDNSDETGLKLKNRVGFGDGVTGSDPGSPAFGSASSALQLPSLPPVKTKLDDPNPVQNPGEVSDPVPQQLGGPVWGPGSNPGSPYTVHHHTPVFYMQPGLGQGLLPQRNSHLQPVPAPVSVQVPVPVQVPVQMANHFVPQFGPGHVAVGYQNSGPVYGPVRAVSGMDQYEMHMQGNMVPVSVPGPGQPVYYGVKNPGFPGMVVQPVSGEEMAGYGPPGSDPQKGRTMQS